MPLVLFLSLSIHKGLCEEYECAAKHLRDENSSLILAKLETTNEINKYPTLYYKVWSVPKLLIFSGRGDKVEEYNGPHDREAIVAFLKRLSAPFPAQISSAQDATRLIIDKKTIVIVGVFPEFFGQHYENFMAAAEILKWDYDICLALGAKHLPLGDSSLSGPIVRMFVPFDDGFVDTDTFNVDALVEFARDNSTPVVFLCDDHPYKLYNKFFKDKENEKAMLYINRKDESAGAFESKYRELAKKYRGQGLIFMLGDLEANEQLSNRYFDYTSEYPLIVIKNIWRKEYYVKRYLEVDKLETWVDDYKAGKVAQDGESEPIPLENNEPVKVIVGDTFLELVMGQYEKSVLLELYRPEFENCAKVASVLHDVAVHFEEKDDGGIVVAKLDESVNDIRGEFEDDLRTIGDSITLYLVPARGHISVYEALLTNSPSMRPMQEPSTEFVVPLGESTQLPTQFSDC
ncbi:hypothetical protein ACFE04_030587 [Oxalis oulophora]